MCFGVFYGSGWERVLWKEGVDMGYDAGPRDRSGAGKRRGEISGSYKSKHAQYPAGEERILFG